ncbi:Oligopeptide transport system permease protein OppB [Pseudomonas chlororaphis subsp. aurantiaca]|uniref:ABC transporter permease n=1 Tax=Pseudomonas chlororaphis TaxID=587753 RepID=UPI00087D421E|nr:ABC transporter permease [Pseudomonas chlororaphis]AZD36406.1 Oligopeptide transport system permease protein OppB [Pseudomonas chlororaphis subsp. aurantiaca]AZD42745.1 Oligopeptide transport system permease protein OppB [Pseudomonas chlororaphis subsp. aurantiaca]AZD67680.1 Oligopeptide transport system permease protein OppB [Pseudomonas chlororaphis subsp. aurantiaca]QIT23644.1 ABC transporter permease [Pseudomonas chlororaphis subsp. aurantiaca]WDH01740.1 ABC transporter permease [Pseudo
MSGLLFLGSRLGRALLMIVGVLVLSFLLIRLAPGDPALLMAGEAGVDDPQYIAGLRHDMGLDRPLARQLLLYLGQVATLDLGYSYRNQTPVWTLLAERLPATLTLMGSAFVLSSLLGVALGVLAARARQRRHWLDGVISHGALLLYAMPPFWLAMLLILLFSVSLDWLPAFGMETVARELHGAAWLADRARHLLLPCLSLSFLFLALYIHLTRAATLEAMNQEYVYTAQAKGLHPRRILLAHVLRNALLPVVTFAGLQLGQLASGALLVEVVYSWPGIGRLMYDSLAQRDYGVLMGGFLLISVLVVGFNLLTDLACRLLDPRIGAGGQGA